LNPNLFSADLVIKQDVGYYFVFYEYKYYLGTKLQYKRRKHLLKSVMRIFIPSILLAFLTVITLDAQCPLKKGEYQFNAGLGYSDWGVPIYTGIDFGLFNDITAGIEASFRSYNEDISGAKYTSNVFGIAGNGNYHFNTVFEIPRRWDFYAGITMGYYSWSLPANYIGSNSSGVGFGAQIGGRYFLNKKFGLNLELDGSSSFSGAKFGITYAINK
jgi:outer membrane immunogenic protein